MTELADRRTVLRVGQAPDDGSVSGTAIADALDDVVVETERDFTAALSRVESGTVDCVVADHGSGFDGLSLLKGIRRTRPSFPVVLLPESNDGSVARRAVAADVTGFIPRTEAAALELVVEEIADVVPAGRGDRVRMPIHDRTATEEQRLKERALDEAPVGVTIGDATVPDEPLIYVNDSFEEMTGYDKEEAMGVNCRFLQGSETDVGKTTDVRDAIEREEPVSVELLNYRADGSTFWNNLEISPIRDEDGAVTNFVAFQQDITERKEAEAAIREERETLKRLLTRVEGLLGDLTEILVRADDRASIHRLTVQRIASGDEFERAWIGTYDPTANELTVDSEDGETTIDLDGDRPGVSALDRAVETGEIQSVLSTGLIEPTDGDERAESGVVIPLAYRRTTYGILAVFDEDAEAFDETERTILTALGRIIGSAINDVLSKRTVTADVTITIELSLSDPSLFLVDLSGRIDGDLAYRGTHVGENGSVRFLFAVDEGDQETLLGAVDRYDGVSDASVLSNANGESVVELVAEGVPFVEALTTYGADIESVSIDSTGVRVQVQVATEQNGRAIVEELESTYEGVELLAYHESDANATSPRGFQAMVESELTDRQLVALRKAYASGFFEWPRESEGDDLAESMGVVPSTYYQHLRSAEKKLVRAFFEA